MFMQDTYEEDVKLFEKVDSADADKLLSSGDLAVVFIGRGTCPYCRKFAKKLSGLTSQINTTVYYVDSSNSSDSGIESFRNTYSIPTVPGFIVSKNKEISVRCDSSLPREEILSMIE